MTLLVKNVNVLSGSERRIGRADVFVSGDKISAIGNFPKKRADTVIDGQGAYLAPGFIDVHTNTDHLIDILRNPSQDYFLAQGVTTIIGGYEGLSLSPLIYGSLESLEQWADTGCCNVNWHTVKELLTSFDRRSLGVNFGTLMGYTTVKRALAGDVGRPLTKNELRVLEHLVIQALEEGAFGVSVDTSAPQDEETTMREARSLLPHIDRFRGLFALSVVGGIDSVRRMTEQLRKMHRTYSFATLYSYMEPPGADTAVLGELAETLKSIDEDWMYFDTAPWIERTYPLYRFLPSWALASDPDTVIEKLNDPWSQKRIAKELPALHPDAWVVANAVRHPPLVGATLRRIMEIYGVSDPKEGLLALMRATSMRGVLFEPRAQSDDLLRALYANPRTLISSRGAGGAADRGAAAAPPPRVGAFIDYLSLEVSSGDGSLDSAIRKITSLPARVFRLEGRGEVKEGFFADLAGFSSETTPSSPRNSIHVRFVIVNGKVALVDGTSQGVLAGRALRHSYKEHG